MGSRGPKRRPAADRFWAKVVKTDGCWNWTGATQKPGYGRFVIERGRLSLAHRWAYEAMVGPIPEGMTIDHLCWNKVCVNPDHLEVVTREENARRGNPHTQKTHCKWGHELTPDNVYHPRRNPEARDCRTCRRRRNAEWKRASRAAARAVA